MGPKSTRLLLVLLCGIRDVISEEKEVVGIIGSSVELSCINPSLEQFDLKTLWVYWQTASPTTVLRMYSPGENSSTFEDPGYKNRTLLNIENMKTGDFSLVLSNISLQDERKFDCIAGKKEKVFKKFFSTTVRLVVAANSSTPIISGPTGTTVREEVIFVCNASDVYPEPNVYWIIGQDVLLDPAAQNHNISKNERGLYDVFSTVRITWTSNMRIGCSIENQRLKQNLTTFIKPEDPNKLPSIASTNPTNSPALPVTRSVTTLGVLGILAVMVGVVTGIWLCRKKYHHPFYSGGQRKGEVTEHVHYADHV
ncbi:ICOS ligand isoform X2 [Ornithorhynchus anatinus]|uniref:ICOS ligand n=1 Tax=Ornithorhynchus anatinus TaxID=9258 RepID=A0A6I8NS80_ORNAN|nr:ICOS ligand isoform X2 [Ornithorhynchus anatinus]